MSLPVYPYFFYALVGLQFYQEFQSCLSREPSLFCQRDKFSHHIIVCHAYMG